MYAKLFGLICGNAQSQIHDEITTEIIGDKVKVYILNSLEEYRKLRLTLNNIKLIFTDKGKEEICEISKFITQSWLSQDGQIKIRVLFKENQIGDLSFTKDPQFYEQLQRTTKEMNDNQNYKDKLNIYLEFGKIEKINNLQMIQLAIKHLCSLDTIKKFEQINICIVENVKSTKNKIVQLCKQIKKNILLTSTFYQKQSASSNIFNNNNQTLYNSGISFLRRQVYDKNKMNSHFQSINENLEEASVTQE